jgi:hypothetical protein
MLPEGLMLGVLIEEAISKKVGRGRRRRREKSIVQSNKTM